MKPRWQLVLSVLMIAVLMVTAVGIVCHHHQNPTAAANCTLCHMALEPVLGGVAACGFVLQSSAVVAWHRSFSSRLRAAEATPRAPPA